MAEQSWGDLLKQAEAEGFTSRLVDQGQHNAVVEQTNHKRTSTGKPQVGVMYRIVGGAFDGATLWDNIILTADNPKAMKIWFEKWRALGVSIDDFSTLPSGEAAMPVLADMVIGRAAVIQVTHEEWNGEKRAKVKPKRPLEAHELSVSASAPAPAGNIERANPLLDSV